jgi:hypothetical protein
MPPAVSSYSLTSLDVFQVLTSLPRGPFRVGKLARWIERFPADLVVWQEGKSEAAGVLLRTVLNGYRLE